MNKEQLASIASAMVEPHKGILAADESSPTIKKRFDTIQLESSQENRRACSSPLPAQRNTSAG